MAYQLRPATPLAWVVHWLLKIFFRFRAYGGDDLNAKGPILLIPNHVSWLDFIYMGVCLPKDWRFVTSSTTAEVSWVHRRIMRSSRAFPVDTSSPYAVKHIAAYLRSGGRLVLFAEGRISTTGSLMKLFEGTGFLLLKTHAKIITAYIRGANCTKFVRHTGWTRWFPALSVHFSPLMDPPQREYRTTVEGRRRLTYWLRRQMVNQRFEVETKFGPQNVLEAVIQNRYENPANLVLSDMTRTELSYKKILVGIEVLAQQWPHHLPADRHPIGMLLPNVNACPITLFSLWASGRVPALLNYSSGMATIRTCCQLAGIKTIITSRQFLEKAKLDISVLEESGIQFVYLESVREQITTKNRLTTLLKQSVTRPFQDRTIDSSQTAVILFTSGSEGTPKGVELTHANLMANINQMLSVIDVTDHECAFNALPMFHSFGLTIGTLLPLVRGFRVILYPSPLHYRMVPALVYDQDCTILLGTNTFLSGYARRAHAYDFRSVRYLFAGAEKTQEETFTTWANKYGIRILEGYGATECSPCISVNTPLEVSVGTAGCFLPGIEHRIEPVAGVEDGGRLFVRGPNVMKGYLNPEPNARFKSLDGWYDTGDIANIDSEGFVHILGRLKRFAKVSGEMISLTGVEEALAGRFKHHTMRAEVAILSQPDPRKGERLIAVANHPAITLEAIRDEIKAAGHSNLSIPRVLKTVREIPKLGSGKTDYRSLECILENET